MFFFIIGFSLCLIYIFGDENSNKLYTYILQIQKFDKLLQDLSLLFQRVKSFNKK